ncbi:MAG: iron-containing alcohol dehydrogenase [Oligoflexia bacterium]|nr:iron-containing alcohol dehydrogenase [Oligoflexia bacterium]
MEKFKFNVPTVYYFGKDEFERVRKAARQTGKNALIVTGKGSVKKHGYLDKLCGFLNQEKISYEIFEGIEPNPRHSTINKAGILASQKKCDMVIALGGGSVMDASKGIAVVAQNGGDIWDYCSLRDRDAKKVKSALPLICVPTLAATGSEINGHSVISNVETKQKAVLYSPLLVPRFSIVDPVLTRTVPVSYLVDGAVDIICHCSETYLSCPDDNYVPDFLTLGLVRSVKLSIERLLGNPDDLDARETLSWASAIAMPGTLDGRKGGWPMHEIEHSISALYDISHGLGLAMILPAMVKFDSRYNEKRICRYVGFLLNENTSQFGDGESAYQALVSWLKTIKAIREPMSVDFEKAAETTLAVNGNSEGYIYGIIPMGKKEIIEVLQYAFA